MNIFLIPYTWLRHFAMALWCGAAGLLAWWIVLTLTVRPGPLIHLVPAWPPGWDGPLLLGCMAGMIAMASVLGQGNLERWALWKRASLTLTAGGLAVFFTIVWFNLWHFVEASLIFSGPDHADHASDASLVSLRYRIGAFAMGGLSSGLGPIFVRKFNGWHTHLIGGVAGGLAAAAIWHAVNYRNFDDLYLAGAALGFTWGVVYGLFVWGVPDSLYAGWLRVLSPNRYSRRIPIDAPDGGLKERFVGHFPRGLDLFLGAEDGVQELHVSIRVDGKQRYAARGLSLQPTMVRRFLERVDLRYDPRRPAPLETTLSSGDRIRIGSGAQRAEVEFIMLPREES